MLLERLLGRWDPVRDRFEKMENLMKLMEAGLGLGGGPVRGVNWTARCKEIAVELVRVLGGRPSEDIMSATVTALYQVKPHIIRLVDDADPLTGIQ